MKSSGRLPKVEDTFHIQKFRRRTSDSEVGSKLVESWTKLVYTVYGGYGISGCGVFKAGIQN